MHNKTMLTCMWVYSFDVVALELTAIKTGRITHTSTARPTTRV